MASNNNNNRLPWKTKIGYSFGHVLNDLCASMWFTYLLLYYHKVLQFKNTYAGIILLIGQISDGLATTFVGIFSDSGDNYWLCRKFGNRKAWHIFGTVCVLGSFPFIFLRCIGCEDSDQFAQLYYYASFVLIFQFGWASVQISHLSIIPDITPCKNERTGLTAMRYSMTVLSNIAVYLITWAILGMEDQTRKTVSTIGPEDAEQFRNIMLSCVSAGLVASLLFHGLLWKTQINSSNNSVENSLTDEEYEEQNGEVRIEKVSMKKIDWFKEPQFYLVAGVYMATRLFVNLTQAYMPLYIQITLEINAVFIAVIPLVMFISGLVASSLTKVVNKKIGRKLTFILGCLVGLSGCIWIHFGDKADPIFIGRELYGVAILIGAGGSVMLITSLSLTADLIGQNIESGAFVYGSMSFTDKISNGIAVMLIQSYIPLKLDTCEECREYFRKIMFYVGGGVAVVAIIFMLTLVPFILGKRRERNLLLDRESVIRNEHTPLLS